MDKIKVSICHENCLLLCDDVFKFAGPVTVADYMRECLIHPSFVRLTSFVCILGPQFTKEAENPI